jgi:hypothetical protein
MKYTVIWRQSALDDLAEMWLAAEDRESIRAASDKIDALLRFNPSTVGRPWIRGRRFLVVNKVGITFRISEMDRIVSVLTVWLALGRKNGEPH